LNCRETGLARPGVAFMKYENGWKQMILLPTVFNNLQKLKFYFLYKKSLRMSSLAFLKGFQAPGEA
jgi:hypothetical protein